ncbi:Mitogen-activated protein [Vigna angularis]|uniref:Mitogen-activated protein n=1 Tax=Phaseolus angularis TaxID=3914 RepID=A0A8T0LJC9_PHAAN|nr:Mitogen-activated protein [Vigna angularis]
MRSWWGKSSSKEAKRKENKESIIHTIQRKLKNASEEKCNNKSARSRRYRDDAISKKGSRSLAPSRSPSPSTHVSRCQSFAERPLSQPLPLPGSHLSDAIGANAGVILTSKLDRAINSKPSLYFPLPIPGFVSNKEDATDMEGEIATASVSSESSVDSGNSFDSPHFVSPLASDCENGNRATINSSFSLVHKNQPLITIQRNSRTFSKPSPQLCNNKPLSTSPRGVPLYLQNLQVARPGGLCSAPGSSISSPRNPTGAFGPEQMLNSELQTRKPYPDIASGHSYSLVSGRNSSHISVGGDLSGQMILPQNRCSPECSPIVSPRMTSPGPSSRIQSGTVTPLHPKAGGTAAEAHTRRLDDVKQKNHQLPLPPITVTKPCPFSPTYSASTTPSAPRSPAGSETSISTVQLLMFYRESGEMCAMKEVTLFSDDAKSRESAQQLGQEIAMLSRLRHPNIVQYYGSETIDDRLYVYLEYVSGGSIYKLVKEYGQLGEIAIRNYTRQILLGLAYLHAKNTVHSSFFASESNRVAAMFKIGNSKELPTIPDHLSEDGKDFVRLCLQRNPQNRPSAAQLLEHSFVKNAMLERSILSAAPSEDPTAIINAVRSLVVGPAKRNSCLDSEVAGTNPPRNLKAGSGSSDPHTPREISCPISPSFPYKSLHTSGRMSPPISSPRTASGSSSPLTSGGGAIPYHQTKQSIISHEVSGMIQKSHHGVIPISSPRTASGSSSPLTSSGGAIPYHQTKQSIISHEVSGMIQKSHHGVIPISSPRTASGTSSPLTSGGGAIPFHQSKQQLFSHEVVGMSQKSQNGAIPISSPRTASSSSSPLTSGGGAVPFHQTKQPLFSHEVLSTIQKSQNGAIPISGPRTASGTYSPLTSGGGAVPFHQTKQPLFSHEVSGVIQRSQNGCVPISSPPTPSGSSSPLTCGGGAIPFHQTKQPLFSHEVVGMTQKSQNGAIPISSPRTASGSSSPLTSGGGAIPFHQTKPQLFSNELVGMIQKSLDGAIPTASHRTASGSSPLTSGGSAIPYLQTRQSQISHEVVGMNQNPQHGFYSFGNTPRQGSQHAQFGRNLQTTHACRDVGSSNNNHSRRAVQGDPIEFRDGKSYLADCVSQQLLRDYVRLHACLDRKPDPPNPDRANGL